MPTRGTVLLIEDDRDVREALALLIRDAEGYALATAATGAEALAYVQSNPPPCIILIDVHLPDTRGNVLCAQLRTMPQLVGVPCIFLSGAAKFDASGGDGWLKKPVEIEQLLALLESHCSKREAA
jgi:CheY-like chemotaxis protein